MLYADFEMLLNSFDAAQTSLILRCFEVKYFEPYANSVLNKTNVTC